MEGNVRILVVEDDNDINQLLCNIITKSNYHPQPAYSGTEAILYLKEQNWDLVLLDLMLPGKSGEEILTELTANSEVPVIIISAKRSAETKVSQLRAGADDFITKPFDIEEVSARIDSVLRRYKRTSVVGENLLTFKDLQMDVDAKVVTVAGIKLTLTAREFSILHLLLASPKKVFSKANLFESVWHEPYHGDDNTVNVHMSNLRNKLGQANPEEEYIETIWGMGYRLKS